MMAGVGAVTLCAHCAHPCAPGTIGSHEKIAYTEPLTGGEALVDFFDHPLCTDCTSSHSLRFIGLEAIWKCPVAGCEYRIGPTDADPEMATLVGGVAAAALGLADDAASVASTVVGEVEEDGLPALQDWEFELCKELIEGGGLDPVNEMLATKSVTEDQRGELVAHAAVHDKLSIVQALLDNGSITQAARGDAVCRGSTNWNMDLLNTLLANGPIPTDKREQTLLLAASMDKPEFVGRLLVCGEELIAGRADALGVAAVRGYTQVVDLLIEGVVLPEDIIIAAHGVAEGLGQNEIADTLSTYHMEHYGDNYSEGGAL